MTRIRAAAVPVLAPLLLAVATLVYLVDHFRGNTVVDGYIAPQYWLDYSDGFTRRGLPGAVLSLGGSPSYATVRVAAVALTVLAVASVVALAAVYARQRSASGLVLALVLTSPFTLTMLARDLGRYDDVGYVALAVIALWSTPRFAVPVIAVALLVATGTEEFLLPFLLPAAYVRLRSLGNRQVAIAVAPALVLALASLLLRPSVATLADAISKAHAAHAPYLEDGNALSFIGFTLNQEIHYAWDYSGIHLPVAALIALVIYAASVFLLGLHRDRDPVVRLGAIGWLPLLSLALDAIGIDTRRWWSLAFVSLIALAVARGRSADVPEVVPNLRVATLLVSGLFLADMPLDVYWHATNLLPWKPW